VELLLLGKLVDLIYNIIAVAIGIFFESLARDFHGMGYELGLIQYPLR